MGTFQVGLLLIGTFALLLALSVPVSVSIIISSVVTMASTLSLDLGTFVASQRMVGGVDSFSLLAVPFYILCGVLMNTGGIAQKLIDFAKILVGRIPGGLAHTNILGNTLFGSLSGSSVAASVAIGGVLIPMEEKEGYDKKFAAAVNIASAPTGLIIPPSGILIIYPVLAGCSVVGMIMSGYIPGLMWALAILIGAKFFDNFCKREGLPPKVSESIFIYGTLATIIGARLGHCLFYDPMEYLSKPWTIITGFRDGGMASHGAAIGLLIGLWLFSRKNKLPYIWSLDRIMIAVGIGGAVVRLGNLFNSEIFGMATTLPWGFEFVRSAKWVNEFAPAAVHPTQIYEALCYLITFGILCWLYYAKDIARRRPGILFGIGLLGIFLTRFFIEFIKTEQEAFEQGWVLDMGQWLSIPFIVLGIYMIYRGLSEPEVTPAPVPKAPAATPKKKKR